MKRGRKPEYPERTLDVMPCTQESHTHRKIRARAGLEPTTLGMRGTTTVPHDAQVQPFFLKCYFLLFRLNTVLLHKVRDKVDNVERVVS